MPGWADNWDRYKSKQPTIAAWLNRVKTPNHASAAIRCQRVEASVMVRRVVADLMANHPTVPLVTIHDAILTVEDGIPIVEQAITRAWAVEGVIPRMKVEPA